MRMTLSRIRIDWMPEDFFVPGFAASEPRKDGHTDVWLDDTSLQIVNNTSPLPAPIMAVGDERFDVSSEGDEPLPMVLLDGRQHWLLAGWETTILPPYTPKE